MKKNASKIISLVLAAALTVTSFTYTSLADGKEAAADEVVEVVDESVETDAAEDTPAVETDEGEAAPEADEIVPEADETAPEEEAVPEGEAAPEETAPVAEVSDEEAEEAVVVEDDVEAPLAELGTPEVGKTYTLNFVEALPAAGYVPDKSGADEKSKVSSITDKDNIIAYTGTGFYNDTQHGLAVKAGDTIEVAVAGKATVSVAACLYPTGSSAVYKVTDAAGTELDEISAVNATDGGTNKYDYPGTEPTVLKLTASADGFLHSVSVVSIEDIEIPDVGESFVWWFDEANNGGTVAPGDYEAGNGAATITVVPGLAGESYTAQNAEFEYEGKTHKPYKSSNRPDNAGKLTAPPTSGNSYILKPYVNGMATFYNYVPSGKTFLIMDYYNGASTVVETDAVTNDGNDSFTISAEANHQYACYTGGTNGLWFYGVKFLKNEPVDVPVSINAAEGISAEVYFVDVDTQSIAATVTGETKSIILNKGHTYELRTNDGGIEAQIKGGLEYKFDGTDANIVVDLIELSSVTLSGPITSTVEGVSADKVTKIIFTKLINDEPVPAIKYEFGADVINTADSTYSVEIKPGDYATSVEAADGIYTNDHVKIIKNTNCVNEIYLEKDVPAPAPIAFKSEVRVPGDFDTMKEALAAIKTMKGRPEGEAGRVTIVLTADLLEQVNMDVDYVTVDGQGQYKIEWYYGTGTTYYSIDDSGFYNESLFRDKYYSKGAAKDFWGGVMIVYGNYFKAHDVTFRNIYNYGTVTEKEGADIASCSKDNELIQRKTGTNVKTAQFRERSNALAIKGKYSEYTRCDIEGSQDTLGWNGDVDTQAYFKDCIIKGNCDYICGSGTLVFDNCDLVWFTEGAKSLGYITAPRARPYIFRDCNIVLEENPNCPSGAYGLFGRPWGGKDATAYFIRCNTNGTIGGDCWTNMSGVEPENANFYEYNNTTDGTTPFPKSSKGKIPAADDPAISDDDSTFLGSFLGGWAPAYGDWKLKGDINNDSRITAMDATALLWAARNPNDVPDEWNYSHHIANVAGTYDENEDLNKLIDGQDVQAIMSKVLNYAYEFKNTPTTGGEEGGGGQGGEEGGGNTPTPSEPGETFACTDSYPQEEGWAQEFNTATEIDRAYANDVAGNTSAKIRIGNKAVLKILKVPHTSGKVKLSVDFLRDSTLSGRTFRLYVENKALLNYGDKDIATDDLNPNGVIYQLMDIKDDNGESFYVMGQNTGGGDKGKDDLKDTDKRYGDIESGKWYRYEVVIDLDAGKSTTTIYRHGADGTYTEDASALVPVGQPIETNLIATSNGEGNKIAQIRLVRTAAGPVYWDNIKLETVE